MASILDGTKVLLIDDDLLTLEMYEFVLQNESAVVKKARSVAEAKQILESWQPDLIVSDIGMPGEDGRSFIRAICADQTRKIPVIAVTGYGSAIDHEELYSAGCSDVLIKPIDPFLFISKLEKLRKT